MLPTSTPHRLSQVCLVDKMLRRGPSKGSKRQYSKANALQEPVTARSPFGFPIALGSLEDFRTSISDAPPFDLCTTIHMAASAWQAYLNPTEGEKFTNTMVNGTSIQYFSQDVVLNEFAAVVKVTVGAVDANVRSRSISASKKPAVRVTVGTSTSVATRHSNWEVLEEGEPDDSYLWVRKRFATDAPLPITVQVLDGDGEQGERVRSEGVLELQQNWQRLGEGFSKTLSLGSPEPGGQSYTVELKVSVLELIPVPGATATMDEIDAFTELGEESRILLEAIQAQGHLQFTSNPFMATSMNPMDTYEERNSPEFKPSTGDSNPISQKIRPACRRMGVAETPKSIAAPDELNVLPFQATLKVDEFLADTFMSLSEMFPNHFMDGAEKVAFIENGPTDTQCLVLRNSRLKEVAIAFRGTEVSKPQDIWTDLQLTPSIFRAEGPEKDGEREPIFNSFFGGGNKPAVHSGFLKAWRSVQKAVEEVVECAADGEQGWKVYTCGHSLGGALAVLAAASYAAKGRTREQVACYTFGCPRVGNDKFIKQFNKNIPESWRVYNMRDSIASVPRLTGFVQPNTSVAFKRMDSNTKIAFKNPKIEFQGPMNLPVCSEVRSRVCIPYSTVRTWGEFLQNEIRMGRALFSGLGLKQHSSPEYMQSLTEIMRSITDDEKVLRGLDSSEKAVEAWAQAEQAAREAQRDASNSP